MNPVTQFSYRIDADVRDIAVSEALSTHLANVFEPSEPDGKIYASHTTPAAAYEFVEAAAKELGLCLSWHTEEKTDVQGARQRLVHVELFDTADALEDDEDE